MALEEITEAVGIPQTTLKGQVQSQGSQTPKAIYRGMIPVGGAQKCTGHPVNLEVLLFAETRCIRVEALRPEFRNIR